ncbi:MAG: hypothetical protein Q8K14_15625, partial [Hydrogenophaga sp.]|uniref:hypothetical protein n=1 Tax=Hydrogenophaga sp. TaxID=1904254 RepID=UPI00272F0FC2
SWVTGVWQAANAKAVSTTGKKRFRKQVFMAVVSLLVAACDRTFSLCGAAFGPLEHAQCMRRLTGCAGIDQAQRCASPPVPDWVPSN